ncbi:peptide-methionine (S)-S-oxide reductase MsrA [Francisella tularensis]|uniref:Peptide methionine sulfoxide reductase MsrA n=4 Tax=Francisella tularensis TaxID=263 RepID=A0AAJ1P614_FRATH|nr:peptide-methionine (S)-S-oxide reductase MsrA [Francisella tularensis]ABI83614.1 protein-methionine-S-oxide reductase [Francisella tularensis subsp. holarctica OSU18]ABU62549.1 methionine-S-sulfoxide reductase [Francisella tularensis subsp. holarctica FTNF002-00]AFT93482.1 peptide methionine sulfoxide reductase [Francisella tularensis subsp. holarctica FSC200]AJI51504.1 peptide-methionine (S)-S-oxide reductase [Francisella tularensis subsp. holarctica]AJI58699.1 peptide-methionine (S)-S-oxi
MIKKIIYSLSILSCSLGFSANSDTKYEKAIFAGGCFWCLESDFEYMQKHQDLSHNGIIKVISGYDGGLQKDPTYKTVSAGITNYKESVEVIYDPTKISYQELVEYFYRRIDPTDFKGQFCDKGKQYQSAIYYNNDKQKQVAEEVTKKLKEEFKKHNQSVYTQILPSTHFYKAESYHQDYHHKNPKRYCYYRTGCGRDLTINKVWQNIDCKYSNVVPFDIPSSYAECLIR